MAQRSVVKEAVIKLVTDGLTRVHAELKSVENQAAKLKSKTFTVEVKLPGGPQVQRTLDGLADAASRVKGHFAGLGQTFAASEIGQKVSAVTGQVRGLADSAKAILTKPLSLKVSMPGAERAGALLSGLGSRAAAFGSQLAGVARVAGPVFGAVAAAAGAVTDKLAAMGEGVKKVTGAAQAGFLGLVGSVTALVAVADPVRFTLFTQLLQVFAARVGSLFIPVLDKAVRGLAALIEWFDHLSAGTKRNIVSFTLLLGVALGAVAALGTLLAVGLKVAAFVSAVGAPVLAVVAALGALAAGIVLVAGKGDLLAGLQTVFERLRDAAVSVWQFARPYWEWALERIKTFAASVNARLTPAFERVQAAVMRAWAAIQPVFNALWEYLQSIAEVNLSILGDGLEVVGNLAAWVAEKAAWLAEKLGPALATGIDIAKTSFQTFVTAAIDGINKLVDGINLLIRTSNKLNPLFDLPELGKLSLPDFAGVGKPVKKAEKTEKKPGMAPLLAPMKVEQLGIEELSKRAQQAVNGSNDPARIAEMQRKLQAQQYGAQQEGNALLKDIYKKINPQPQAAFSY